MKIATFTKSEISIYQSNKYICKKYKYKKIYTYIYSYINNQLNKPVQTRFGSSWGFAVNKDEQNEERDISQPSRDKLFF